MYTVVVDDSLAVGVEQAACNLADNDFDGIERELAFLLQDVGEGIALHVRHRDEQLVVLNTEVKDVDDVLVVQFLHRLGFQVEPLDGFFVGGGVEDLEGDFALEFLVEGLEDKAHSPFAQSADQVVVFVKRTRKFIYLESHFAFFDRNKTIAVKI